LKPLALQGAFLYGCNVMKTLKQQIEDSLWYLKHTNPTEEHFEKGVQILEAIVGKKRAKDLAPKFVNTQPLPINEALDVQEHLMGKTVVVIRGHEPGGGAKGERSFNKKVQGHMIEIYESWGVKVLTYEHKMRNYRIRQDQMRAWILKNAPEAFICHELHYDAYNPRPTASGHHFQYLGAEELARFTADEFQRRFPQSYARHNKGILKNTNRNGSGFLRKCPCWAILTEPFFITNPSEDSFFKDKHYELAEIYCIGAARFAKFKANAK